MEIRKTSSRIFTEKLEAVKKRIRDAGFWVKEDELGNLKIQHKKGIFQKQLLFEFDDKKTILILNDTYPNEEDKEFCRELENKSKVKIIIYLD
ncbi:MAG: hypothetical protein AABY22_22825 [Nanoarchaeota archaeon]